MEVHAVIRSSTAPRRFKKAEGPSSQHHKIVVVVVVVVVDVDKMIRALVVCCMLLGASAFAPAGRATTKR